MWSNTAKPSRGIGRIFLAEILQNIQLLEGRCGLRLCYRTLSLVHEILLRLINLNGLDATHSMSPDIHRCHRNYA